MKIVQDMLILNKYDPINRYKRILSNENDTIKDLTTKILLSLNAIDITLHEQCKSDYHFYIKDDSSIYNLLCKVYETEDINIKDFERAIFILDFGKLIYRFTCAKKFKEDNNITQLRLNSWGRVYICSYLSVDQKDFKVIEDYFEEYCKKNIKLYKKLTKLLLQDLDDETLNDIDLINSIIEIKLLS